MKLYCATGNPGKLREFRLGADDAEIELELLPGFKSLPPAVESGATFEENAILKARHYAMYAPGLVFADDSGLEVNALGGEPGVHSARYAGEHGNDEANNRRLLENLRGVENRAARFVCAIAVVDRAQLLGTFRGTVDGRIIDQPRGSEGFGYDPLFFYEPFGCTFGEATGEQKLHVSHRGRAMTAMLAGLRSR